MEPISSEQKLRLVHSIREEHKNNQMTMNHRESVLFGTPLPLVTTKETEEPYDNDKPHTFSYRKIRFLLAILLFLGFLFLDITDTQILGIDSTAITTKISEDYRTNLFDFIETIPYTQDNTDE
ncbi:MAG: hypothetical protein RRX92_07295 [Lachnospiraceae bacterium]